MTRTGMYANPGTCPHPVTARVWPELRSGRGARRGPKDAIALCHDCGMWQRPHGWTL